LINALNSITGHDDILYIKEETVHKMVAT